MSDEIHDDAHDLWPRQGTCIVIVGAAMYKDYVHLGIID